MRDAGPGLTGEELRQIFKPFAQAENQPRSGKGRDFVGAGAAARLRDDHGADQLRPALVGQADTMRFRHGGVELQDLLDL